MIENYLQRRSLTTCFFGSQFETMTVTTKVWKQYPNWIPWYLVQFFLGIQGKNWTNRENWKIHRNWDTPKDTGRLEISVISLCFVQFQVVPDLQWCQNQHHGTHKQDATTKYVSNFCFVIIPYWSLKFFLTITA